MKSIMAVYFMADAFKHDNNQTAKTPEVKSNPSEIQTSKTAEPVFSTRYYQKGYEAPPTPPARESAARERVRKRHHQRDHKLDWAWIMIAGVLFIVVIVISMSLFLILRSAGDNMEVIPTANVAEILPTPLLAHYNFASDLGIGKALELPDGSSIELVPWDGVSRYTFVMVGLDRRLGETGLAYRTDTMMLISIDPTTQSIGLLSIPRDLYVQVPGYGSLQRINSPMVLGEYQSPGYGPTLMMQTVQLNLGMRVNDFVAVDFKAFIDLVDLLGGIDINNEYTINDNQYPDLNYGYDPFYLPAGQHHLNGYNALRYARTRHGDSDINRAERQQQVLYAIRDRALNPETLPKLVLQAPSLWQSWQENVYTGLTLEQIVQLGLYVKDIPPENIKMGIIDFDYLRSYTTPEGASVLIPNRAALANLMIEIFGSNYNQ